MRKNFLTYIAVAAATSMAALFSCQGSGNAPSLLASETTPSSPLPVPPTIPSNGNASYALVYGSSAGDRSALSDRIAGYQAPGLSVVFSQWRRFAGNQIFNTTADLVPRDPGGCFTSFDVNYNWVSAVSGGVTIIPGTNSSCVNSNVFVSTSWNYIPSPDRIYNAANGTSFNGFLSALKFDTYTLQATLYSADADNDGIGLVIAAYTDSSNNVHTLTAMRTHAGMDPTAGWGVLYKMNNTLIRTFGAQAAGPNSSGWAGRNTVVRVERTNNIIKASTSPYAVGASSAINSAYDINIDLSDPAVTATAGMSDFQGEQYYGYGTISQLGATFSNITFTAENAAADPTYLYDLLNNVVYYKDITGYSLLSGVAAYSTLSGGSYPLRVINNETQKEYRIDSSGGYTEL